MSIHQDLKNRIPEALKAKDETLLTTLRSLVTLMTQEVMKKGRKPDEFLTDEEALATLKRASNMRKDSIEQFDKAGRDDLSSKEKAELAIIETFLPAQMSEEDVRKIAEAKKAELGITDKKEAGKLMGIVMKETKGSADGAVVKAVVDSLF